MPWKCRHCHRVHKRQWCVPCGPSAKLEPTTQPVTPKQVYQARVVALRDGKPQPKSQEES